MTGPREGTGDGKRPRPPAGPSTRRIPVSYGDTQTPVETAGRDLKSRDRKGAGSTITVRIPVEDPPILGLPGLLYKIGVKLGRPDLAFAPTQKELLMRYQNGILLRLQALERRMKAVEGKLDLTAEEDASVQPCSSETH